jgi:Fic family protein
MGDGNGRLARVILNIVLECHNYPPIVVQAARKAEYDHCLLQASLGDLRPFCRLIMAYVAHALQVSEIVP